MATNFLLLNFINSKYFIGFNFPQSVVSFQEKTTDWGGSPFWGSRLRRLCRRRKDKAQPYLARPPFDQRVQLPRVCC